MSVKTKNPQPVALPSHVDFLRKLFEKELINREEARMLQPTGVRSVGELMSLIEAFPTVGLVDGVELPRLSNDLARAFPSEMSAYRSSVEQAKTIKAERFGFGYTIDEPEGAAAIRAPEPPDDAALDAWFNREPIEDPLTREMSQLEPIDVRCRPEGEDWAVRHQGNRGSCVAFAAVACAEYRQCGIDLSEQFLYCLMKEPEFIGDSWPGEEGSTLSVAAEVFEQFGVCMEHYWPYNPEEIPGNVSHRNDANPDQAAMEDARESRGRLIDHRQPPGGKDAARKLYDLLAENGRPVAVGLPVFTFPDPNAMNTSDNWQTLLGTRYGHVLDPLPMSIRDGGHAVCITGFVPDSNVLGGGSFIIRNSWGTGWGGQLPSLEYPGPETGYGDISAEYISRYVHEMRQF